MPFPKLLNFSIPTYNCYMIHCTGMTQVNTVPYPCRSLACRLLLTHYNYKLLQGNLLRDWRDLLLLHPR